MNHLRKPFHVRGARGAAATIAALTGFAVAALVGVAAANTFTLQVAKGAKVTNQSGSTVRENIVVNSRGFAVYDLTGESKTHPECTKAEGCFKFWPPVTVSPTAGSRLLRTTMSTLMLPTTTMRGVFMTECSQ